MTKKKEAYLVLFFHFLMLVCFNFAHPVTPAMLAYKEAPDYLFGLLFMMMSIGTFLASPYWGNKIDINGTKKIMALAPFLYAIGQLILAVSSSNILMLLGRLIAGVFASAWIVGTNSAINILVEDKMKAKFFGYIMVMGSLGAIVGQLSSGYIGVSYWQYSFVAQIVGLILLGIFMCFFLKNHETKTKVSSSKKKLSASAMLKVVKKEQIGFVLLSMIMFIIVTNLLVSSTSYFSENVLGFSPIQISQITAVSTTFTLLGNLFIVGFLSSRYSYSKIIKIELIFGFIGYIILISDIVPSYFQISDSSATESLLTMIIAIAIINAFISINRAITQKHVVSNTKTESGQMLGIINSANAIGMIAGSLTLSITYVVSPVLPFIMLGIFLMLAGVFYVYASKKENNKE